MNEHVKQAKAVTLGNKSDEATSNSNTDHYLAMVDMTKFNNEEQPPTAPTKTVASKKVVTPVGEKVHNYIIHMRNLQTACIHQAVHQRRVHPLTSVNLKLRGQAWVQIASICGLSRWQIIALLANFVWGW